MPGFGLHKNGICLPKWKEAMRVKGFKVLEMKEN